MGDKFLHKFQLGLELLHLLIVAYVYCFIGPANFGAHLQWIAVSLAVRAQPKRKEVEEV